MSRDNAYYQFYKNAPVIPALVASFVDLPKRPTSNRLLALNVLQVQVVLVRKVGPQVEHVYLLFCDASDPEKIS